MQDRFETTTGGLNAPATHGFAIVPNDGVELPEITRALYVGSGGTVSAVLMSGADLLLTGLTSGTLLPIRVRRINATGTTAAALIGLV